MKFALVALLVFAAYAQARVLEELPITSAYNYLEKSVALADQRRAFEEELVKQRVVGGAAAGLGQIPWQVRKKIKHRFNKLGYILLKLVTN